MRFLDSTSYIYYPEFEIEELKKYVKLSDYNPDHLLNIRLLLLLCNKVVIPPSHLLDTSISNIMRLSSNLKDFFGTGKIVTTLYNGDARSYYSNKVDSICDATQKSEKSDTAKLILDRLFFNSSVKHHQSSDNEQIFMFNRKYKDLLQESVARSSKKSIELVLNKMDDLNNSTGNYLRTRQVQSILTSSFQSGNLSAQKYRQYFDLEQLAYFYCGTNTMNMIVSYNPYFERIKLRDNLVNETEPMYVPNMIFDPRFLLRLLNAFEISGQDILKLSNIDYDALKAHRTWKLFTDEVRNLREQSHEIENIILSQKNALKRVEKIKEIAYNVSSLAIVELISSGIFYLLPLSFPFSIGVNLTLALLKWFLSANIKTMNNSLKVHTTDKVVGVLSESYAPILAFSEKLKIAVKYSG